MLTPTRLIIRGFRGFLREQEFRFDSPAVILFGENRCGKSSTLNALEWCLFGGEVEGVKTGIRERKEWIIANQHLNPPNVSVELHFDTGDGELIVNRTLSKSAGRGKPRPQLELTLPDGELVKDAIAEQRLAQLLKASFRDFMTMVYQHQETIRGIVMEEPRVRNDAIDRLLGLSDYRNLLTAIKNADLQKRQKTALQGQDEFRKRVETLVSSSARELEGKRQAAIQAGLLGSQLTEALSLKIAQEALQALAGFAKETGVEKPALELPQAWNGLDAFEKSGQQTISRMRGQLPDAKEQENLFKRQTEATKLKGKLTTNKEDQDREAGTLRDLDTKHGGQQSVAAEFADEGVKLKAKEKELQVANSRAALIQKAIEYLERANVDELAGCCPLCENQAPDLLQTLKAQWQEVLQGQVAEINAAIQSHKDRREALQTVANEYREANDEQKRFLDALHPLREEVEKLIGKKLQSTDDPIALLNADEKRIEDRLKELEGAIGARQERLNQISMEFSKVRRIWEFLDLEEKKRIIDHIEESREWQALEQEKDRISRYVDDLEAIKTAITIASHEEGTQKLSTAEKTIDDFFRRLTKQPVGKGVKLTMAPDTRSGTNAYAITDQDGKDLTPILSQGDMNALALAIFLGLACSSAETASFKFVLLDDPSQSLGSEYKEQLVSVLDRVAGSRRVIVATMDSEFCSSLQERLTKGKTLYRFKAWSERDGASAERV